MLRNISPLFSILKFTTNKFKPIQSQSQPKQQLNSLKQIQKTNYGSLRTITQQRKTSSLQFRKKFKQNLPTQQLKSFAQQHLCQVTLYMKHDQWKSQYIYAIMNYQQLGFTRISDYVFLKQIGRMFQNGANNVNNININKDKDKGNDNKKQQKFQWPIMKFKSPLQQTQYLLGLKQIINFIDKKQLFIHQIDDDIHLTPTIQKYINQKISPYLQIIFWHPKLTFQQIFHTNLSSYSRVNINYKLIVIFFNNIFRVSNKICKNLFKILQNKQEYNKSRQNLIKGLQEIITMLNGKQYIGGNKPNHLDFYLFAILNTKISSKNFQMFLRKDIGGLFWDWFYRMRRVTQYDKQRVTLL